MRIPAHVFLVVVTLHNDHINLLLNKLFVLFFILKHKKHFKLPVKH